ncbi:LANO_0B07558g1_1 [Lachancea nothofagi CBS 11611]|uniref:LANO_0B07558g1_1 n=1 Tax=Lachancea nothofagi CBS 11611 TaxID=1266666 RepID=A0A1G4IZS4_9SACH|nr:LANO_0B07558g1_1 [Lachancea nothofagi CBS 11611]
MGSNSSNSDQLAQIGRAVSTTASAIFGSQSMEDTILSYSSPYKKLLHQTITHSGSSSALTKLRTTGNPFRKDDNKAFQDIYSAPNGRSFFENQFSNTKTSFRVLSYLSEDLLNDVPNSGSIQNGGRTRNLLKQNGDANPSMKPKSKSMEKEPSLFQGFTSSLPTINETISTGGPSSGPGTFKHPGLLSNVESSANPQQNDEGFSLPTSSSWNELNETYSLKKLRSANQSIIDNLDLLEIQKNLAASEIKEIDLKLEKLKMVRDLVFKRVARVEQNEIFLEKHLAIVRDRIDLIEENGLDDDESTEESHGIESENQKPGSVGLETADTEDGFQGTENESDDEETSALMSKSIYQKMKKSPPNSKAHYMKASQAQKRLQQNSQNNHNRRRKTYPTLQQFYEPGSKIASFPKAHDDSITCLDFDMPFGTMCTAGKLDHSVKIWDLSKKVQTASLPGHLASVSCMQMNEPYTLITGGRDALLKLWDVEKAEDIFHDSSAENEDELCLNTFDAHVDEITALHLEGNSLVSGSQDRTVRQWDLMTGKCLQTIDINFTNRGTSDGFSTVMSHNPRSSVLLTHNDPPVIGALQCYDAAMATGTKDGVVRLWDLRSGQVIRTLEGHTDAVTGLQFDSVNLVSGSLDRSIRIWDLRTGLLADAFAYDSPVSCLQFDLDKIVTANNESSIKVYDRKDARQWTCGGDSAETENDVVDFVRYKHGYLVEGRTNGDVNTWAL